MTPEQLKEARFRLGLSQAELATKLGWTSARHVSQLETGARPISIQTELAVECLLMRVERKRGE